MKMFCHSTYFAANPTKSAKMIDIGPAADFKHGTAMISPDLGAKHLFSSTIAAGSASSA